MRVIILLIITLCSLYSVRSYANSKCVAVVCYYPFEAMTYLPITISKIVDVSKEIWVVDDCYKYNKLISFIKKDIKASFNNKHVRAMIKINNKKYYVDNKGVALNRRSTYRLNVEKIEEFGDMLSSEQRILYSDYRRQREHHRTIMKNKQNTDTERKNGNLLSGGNYQGEIPGGEVPCERVPGNSEIP